MYVAAGFTGDAATVIRNVSFLLPGYDMEGLSNYGPHHSKNSSQSMQDLPLPSAGQLKVSTSLWSTTMLTVDTFGHFCLKSTGQK
jgi:hypothetical protein